MLRTAGAAGATERADDKLSMRELRTPKARRPDPRGMLSPGPRGPGDRSNGAPGAHNKSPLAGRKTLDLVGWGDQGVGGPVAPTPPSDCSLPAASKTFPPLGSSGWNDLRPGSSSGAGSSTASLFSSFAEPVPSGMAATGPLLVAPTPGDGPSSPRPSCSRGGMDGAAGSATGGDDLLSTDQAGQMPDPLLGQSQPRLSSSPPQAQALSLERASSMLNPRCSGWDALPSPEGGMQRVRMATAPACLTIPPLPGAPVAPPPVPVAGTTPSPPVVYGPHALHPPQQWSPPPPPPAQLGHPQYLPGMLGGEILRPQGAPQAAVGMALGQSLTWGQTGTRGSATGPSMDLSAMVPLSPPRPSRSSSEQALQAAASQPQPCLGGTSDAKEYYANRTTVAEERLRRRRLEGWEQQQQQQQQQRWEQQLGTAVDWGSCDAQAADESSPGCAGRAGRSRSQQRGSPPNPGGDRSAGVTCSPTSSATSGGVGSPFRQSERRPRTPPSQGWADGEGGGSGLRRPSSCSQSPKRGVSTASPGRYSPPLCAKQSGRSESVPPRPRSWTGPRSGGGVMGRTSTSPGNDLGKEGKCSADAEEQKLGILLPLDYSG